MTVDTQKLRSAAYLMSGSLSAYTRARGVQLHEAADEIDRLRAIADGAVQNGMDNESLRLRNSNLEGEIERLRALLTDVKRFVWLADPPQDLCEELLARIDAALGGGAPCATCNGTGRVKWAIEGASPPYSEPCRDCGGSRVAS